MAKTLKINIDIGNEAFQDGKRNPELAHILRKLAYKIELGDLADCLYKTLFDRNGNDVGRAGIKGT